MTSRNTTREAPTPAPNAPRPKGEPLCHRPGCDYPACYFTAALLGGLKGCCDYPGCDEYGSYGCMEHAVRTAGGPIVELRACDRHRRMLIDATWSSTGDWLPLVTEQTVADGVRRCTLLGRWWAWGFVFVAYFILMSPLVIQQSLGWTVVPDFRLIVSEAPQFAGYDELGGDGVSYFSCVDLGQFTLVGCVQAESSSASWARTLNNPWVVAWGPGLVLFAFGLLSYRGVKRIVASRMARARWSGANERRERAVCWAVALAIPYGLLVYAIVVTAIVRPS